MQGEPLSYNHYVLLLAGQISKKGPKMAPGRGQLTEEGSWGRGSECPWALLCLGAGHEIKSVCGQGWSQCCRSWPYCGDSANDISEGASPVEKVAAEMSGSEQGMVSGITARGELEG